MVGKDPQRQDSKKALGKMTVSYKALSMMPSRYYVLKKLLLFISFRPGIALVPKGKAALFRGVKEKSGEKYVIMNRNTHKKLDFLA